MATDMNELREVTDKMQPIYNKLVNGDTALTQDEIDTFGDAYNKWHDYTAGRV